MTVVFDSMARVFYSFGATWAVALDISKAFNRFWRAGLLHRLKSYRILGQVFGLILSFSVIGIFQWFWMESLPEFQLHERPYPFMLSSPQEDGGIIFFALGGLYCGEPWWGEGYLGGMLFFSLRGRIIWGLVFYVSLMKNLLVVNINYLLMTYHLRKSYDTYFKHDNSVVKLSLMPINLIFLSTQRNLKSIIHLSLLLSWICTTISSLQHIFHTKNWSPCLTSFHGDKNNHTGGHQALLKRNVSILEVWFITRYLETLISTKFTNIDSNILNQADTNITKTLLFDSLKYSSEINLQILNASINFIPTSKTFDEPVLNY